MSTLHEHIDNGEWKKDDMPNLKEHIEKEKRKLADVIWNQNGKHTHNELDEIISSSLSSIALKTLSEVREKIKLMEIYDIDDTPRTVVNMNGYNDAIRETLQTLDTLEKEIEINGRQE